MTRRGRKRKLGRRKPCGRLVPEVRASPKEIARTMPHRRGLKDAANPLAESELGRMVLRGELEPLLATAGEMYRREWKGWIASLCAPNSLAVTSGAKPRCDGCQWTKANDFCLCAHRKRIWNETRTVLADTGCTAAVDFVCLHDKPVFADRWMLRLGLEVLARHYGLTGKTNVIVQKARSKRLMKTPPVESSGT